VKTITIRLPDVEAAMLMELQKKCKTCRNLDGWMVQQIRQEYAKAR